MHLRIEDSLLRLEKLQTQLSQRSFSLFLRGECIVHSPVCEPLQHVKSFAHHMMLDHTKLTVQLKMAAPHSVAVPKDNSDTAVLDSLKPLKGADFDKADITKVGLEGHQQAITAFEKETSDGQAPDLKKAAQKALPTIKAHYQIAQQLAYKKGVAQ